MSEPSAQAQLGGDLVQGAEKHCTLLEWVEPIASRVGGFDLDPCASPTSALADDNQRGTGGLQRAWKTGMTVWMNHPFADPGPWHKKALASRAELVVGLSKADPSADWFHNYAKRADLLVFPSKRVEFIGYDNSAGFPVVYSCYGDVPDALREWFAGDSVFDGPGWVVKPQGGADE
jgi:hypothetical protein